MVLIGLSAAFAATAGERITLKLAHDLERQHIVAVTFDRMAEEVKTLSNGEITLRVYPNSQMGNARDTMELLQNGGLDMTKGSANLETFAEIYSVFSMPYLFNSKEHHDKVVYGPVGREIFASTKDKGFFVIAAFDCGTRSYYAKKPILKPEDLAGLKIRVQASPTGLRMVELTGGLPTPVAFSEVYTALQQGVVDGAENNIPTWVHTRNIEVAKVYTENEHTMVPDFLAVSTKSWDKLSRSHQEILLKAAASAEDYQRKIWAEEMIDARRRAAEQGGTIVQVDKAPFRARIQPIWDDYLKDPAHKAVVDRIWAADK
ncbi:MAG: TRAP transporter substrate-binding protein [Planctomycetota bacterium]|nr:TRAP transporter substrate-binding protein [Planctomycetota bacterium]